MSVLRTNGPLVLILKFRVTKSKFQNFDLVTRNLDLLSRNFDLLSRNFDLITRNFDLLS